MDALEDAAESLNVPHVRIDGSTIPARRTTAVQDFQGNADVRVALLSIKAAGVNFPHIQPRHCRRLGQVS